MNVKDKFVNTSEHSIEWGEATWNSSDFSIRNRYDNSTTGKFNKAGSGEIPWVDFKLMIIQSIEKKHFTNKDLSDILKKIADVI